MNKPQKLLYVLLTCLIVFLPVHTLVTVWLAKSFGHLYVWSAWKELLLLVAAGVGGWLLWQDAALRRRVLAKSYNKVALAYILLLTIYLALGPHDKPAVVSFTFSGRFVLIFLLAQMVERRAYESWKKVIIVAGILSAIFGIVQASFLPTNFLTHFGYDPVGVDTSGIPPAIHQTAPNSHVYRAQAAMRGPNVLGAYLAISILLLYTGRKEKLSKKSLLALVLLLDCLFTTYSRSALLGLIGALLVGFYMYGKLWFRRAILLGGLIVIIATTLGITAFRRTHFVQSVVLHHNKDVTTTQSNEGHLEASKRALGDVLRHPLGQGLGSAGPASALDGSRNFAEDYFLQVGQETGWLGLSLLIALHVLVGMALWQLIRQSAEYLPVFLSLLALTFTNLLLHTWVDEVVALTFWALAGVCLTQVKRSKPKS